MLKKCFQYILVFLIVLGITAFRNTEYMTKEERQKSEIYGMILILFPSILLLQQLGYFTIIKVKTNSLLKDFFKQKVESQNIGESDQYKNIQKNTNKPLRTKLLTKQNYRANNHKLQQDQVKADNDIQSKQKQNQIEDKESKQICVQQKVIVGDIQNGAQDPKESFYDEQNAKKSEIRNQVEYQEVQEEIQQIISQDLQYSEKYQKKIPNSEKVKIIKSSGTQNVEKQIKLKNSSQNQTHKSPNIIKTQKNQELVQEIVNKNQNKENNLNNQESSDNKKNIERQILASNWMQSQITKKEQNDQIQKTQVTYVPKHQSTKTNTFKKQKEIHDDRLSQQSNKDLVKKTMKNNNSVRVTTQVTYEQYQVFVQKQKLDNLNISEMPNEKSDNQEQLVKQISKQFEGISPISPRNKGKLQQSKKISIETQTEQLSQYQDKNLDDNQHASKLNEKSRSNTNSSKLTLEDVIETDLNGTLTIQSILEIIDYVPNVIHQTFRKFVEQNRQVRRMKFKEFKISEYLQDVMDYLEKTYEMIDEGQKFVVEQLGLEYQLYLDSLAIHFNNQMSKDIFTHISLSLQILRERMPQKRKILINKGFEIFQYHLEILKNGKENIYLKEIIPLFILTSEQREILYSVLAIVFEDLIWEKFNIENEDKVQFLKAYQSDQQIMNLVHEIESQTSKLVKEYMKQIVSK